MSEKNFMENLGDYVHKVLDTNKDGVISIKDFAALFPNYAIMIAVIFVDIAVAVAEYRVWDVGVQITGDPYKAVGFVLVSAVPFYLGQLFWLYPRATFGQKAIAVLMVAGSLYTSWVFGTADLSMSYDIDSLIGLVVNLTALYILSTLLYILIDPTIKAHRLKVESRAAADREKENQSLAREILSELVTTMKMQQETEKEFGEEAVRAQMNRLSGKKAQAPQQPQFQPRPVPMATDTEKPENFTKGQS